jgi:hypothetical protein
VVNGVAIAKEWPILFSGEMVRALLTGRKSVTRRMSKRWLKVKSGDKLWVRETWAFINNTEIDGTTEIEYRADTDGKCFAGNWPDEERDDPERPKWRPSIFMPREHSRNTLEATEDARLERLQDITEEEAYSEGVTDKWPLSTLPYLSGHGGRAVVNNFAHLWSTLHTKPGERWGDNPEVVRLAFRRIEQP